MVTLFVMATNRLFTQNQYIQLLNIPESKIMKLKHCIIVFLLIVTVNFVPVVVHAQNEDQTASGISATTADEGDGTGGPGDPDTGVPFDGGISILLAAGVAYGLKKKYDQTQSERRTLITE